MRQILTLGNVASTMDALSRAMDRPDHLPGIVALYGPSGVGKSMAASFAANRTRAYYVELRSTWTKKALVQAIEREMGLQPAPTIYAAVDRISEQMLLSGRPLIVDEADYLVQKGNVEIVRDIYEQSQGTILIVGEEALPQKLAKWERFHNRVLTWIAARLCAMEDARKLAEVCPGVTIRDDLLERVVQVAHGITRRVAVNLELIAQTARASGWKTVDAATWGKRDLYTGLPPVRR